jgi:hypothetical protein
VGDGGGNRRKGIKYVFTQVVQSHSFDAFVQSLPKAYSDLQSPKHHVLLAFMLNRQISARMSMNVNETLNGSTK